MPEIKYTTEFVHRGSVRACACLSVCLSVSLSFSSHYVELLRGTGMGKVPTGRNVRLPTQYRGSSFSCVALAEDVPWEAL